MQMIDVNETTDVYKAAGVRHLTQRADKDTILFLRWGSIRVIGQDGAEFTVESRAALVYNAGERIEYEVLRDAHIQSAHGSVVLPRSQLD